MDESKYKMLEIILDQKFKKSRFVKGYMNEDIREPWDVFLIMVNGSKEILIGGPTDGDTFFYNGPILANISYLISVSIEEFAQGLKRYINEKYNLNIKTVI